MKDCRIEGMLSSLEQALGQKTFEVVDHWGDDLTAVGIARPSQPSRLVYIRAMAGGVFDAVLEEAASRSGGISYVEVGQHRNLDLRALIETVRIHLT